MDTKLREVVSHFPEVENVISIEALGDGLINNSWRVFTSSPRDYVLQQINHHIFRDVDLLQHNIDSVTAHIRAKLEAAGEDTERKCLRFLNSDSGKSYHFDGENYWRVSVFIKGSVTKTDLTPETAYLVGQKFGEFESMLTDLPETLGEPIPDFHNMELRIRQFNEALEKDVAGRAGSVKDLTASLQKYADEMCAAERLYREGRLPKRVCHCDTKLANMLFDGQDNMLCVIDLDTVMPSFVFSDFGDFLRSAANTAPEDEPDLSRIHFDLDIFESFAKGYLESTKGFLTPLEREMLPFSAELFPYMQAVRFFTDYLNGDVYYKISYPEHNLVRTKAQLDLFEKVRSAEPQMKKVIAMAS